MMREPTAKELLFVPLGGSGEIGMNFNMYGHDGRWLIVDCGIAFTQERGATDVIMPDPRFAEARRDQLDGIVITHAHEDHLGAVLHLWDRLRCPVYATPFAAAVLQRKFADARRSDDIPLVVIDSTRSLRLGTYTLDFVDVTHSTVESQAVVVGTPLGSVLHTGDFKLDDQPLVGPTTDLEAIAAAGQRGILAAVSDSTNATKDVSSGSEGPLREALGERLADVGDQRIAVACFSSNIARINTFLELAARLDRHPILLGRSLLRMVGSARACSYLAPATNEVPLRDYGYLPPGKVMLICTGTQGEPGSAMDRISRKDHRHANLDRDDLVVFSSKIIPGNEAVVEGLHGRLRSAGVQVASEKDGFVHVSGHPGRPELRRIYELARPGVVVPVHGEARHMAAHADLALEMSIPAVVPFNGAVVRLSPGPAKIVGEVDHGRLRIEPNGRIVQHRVP